MEPRANQNDLEIQPSKDIASVDMITPVIYAPVHLRGLKGEKGDPGKEGPPGPRGPPGKDAMATVSMTSIVSNSETSTYPVTFYFPINRGLYDAKLTITNSPDTRLVERHNAFSIRFNMKGFVNIDTKLISPESRRFLLIRDHENMVDCAAGQCINLKWIGPVEVGTHFMLAGPVDHNINGYWNIVVM